MIDNYDLEACIEYNSESIPFVFKDINQIISFIEGEPDFTDWVWFLELKDTTIGIIRGGCDYTGWD
jgi:hypothetical protein